MMRFHLPFFDCRFPRWLRRTMVLERVRPLKGIPVAFVSYRRKDSIGHASLIADRLKEHFGPDNVFRDIDSIVPAADFVRVMAEKLDTTDVLLALIGPRWLSAKDEAGNPRLSDPSDFVRLELATALRKKTAVLPILVDGAKMPPAKCLPADLKQLARHEALEFSDRRREDDLKQLVRVVINLSIKSKPGRSWASIPLRRRRVLPSLSAALLIVSLGSSLFASRFVAFQRASSALQESGFGEVTGDMFRSTLQFHGDDEDLVDAILIAGNLPGLRELDLSSSEVEDLRPLAALPKLTVLRVADTDFGALNHLKEISSLETLDLSYSSVRDLTSLEYLSHLRRLFLVGSNIKNAEQLVPLKDLRNLRVLHLEGSTLSSSDLGVLPQLTWLRELCLEQAPVDVIPSLKSMLPNAVDIHDDCRISDLEADSPNAHGD